MNDYTVTQIRLGYEQSQNLELITRNYTNILVVNICFIIFYFIYKPHIFNIWHTHFWL